MAPCVSSEKPQVSWYPIWQPSILESINFEPQPDGKSETKRLHPHTFVKRNWNHPFWATKCYQFGTVEVDPERDSALLSLIMRSFPDILWLSAFYNQSGVPDHLRWRGWGIWLPHRVTGHGSHLELEANKPGSKNGYKPRSCLSGSFPKGSSFQGPSLLGGSLPTKAFPLSHLQNSAIQRLWAIFRHFTKEAGMATNSISIPTTKTTSLNRKKPFRCGLVIKIPQILGGSKFY